MAKKHRARTRKKANFLRKKAKFSRKNAQECARKYGGMFLSFCDLKRPICDGPESRNI